MLCCASYVVGAPSEYGLPPRAGTPPCEWWLEHTQAFTPHLYFPHLGCVSSGAQLIGAAELEPAELEAASPASVPAACVASSRSTCSPVSTHTQIRA